MASQQKKRRSEKEGIFNFTREMVSALLMAFIAIVYVIQAFRIPTGSMKDSLLEGDFLLGLKFIYGSPVLPFSYLKFPALTEPKPGQVVIFEYPGPDNKDYIKRCVAGPGQTVAVNGTTLVVDGDTVALPPHGKFMRNGELDTPGITHFQPFRIPAKGDSITVRELDNREFLFFKHYLMQEFPRNRLIKFLESFPLTRGVFRYNPESERVTIGLRLYIDGEPATSEPLVDRVSGRFAINQGQPFAIDYINRGMRIPGHVPGRGWIPVTLNMIDDWTIFDDLMTRLETIARDNDPDKDIVIRKRVYVDEKPVENYVVKHDNYFMMGDNRDNSKDSRYWGYLNRKYVKARAFILYFSWDGERPAWLFLQRIRWGRIGKLIRSFDGENT